MASKQSECLHLAMKNLSNDQFLGFFIFYLFFILITMAFPYMESSYSIWSTRLDILRNGLCPAPTPTQVDPATTFKLEEKVTTPFATAACKKWTAQERLYVSKAHVPHDLNAFGKSVSFTHFTK
jgi:hypothetical protein